MRPKELRDGYYHSASKRSGRAAARLSGEWHRHSGFESDAARTEKEKPFWLRELPYFTIIVLGLIGISWTSVLRTPSATYWEFVTPVVAAICIWSGWNSDDTVRDRIRLIVSQVLHWAAFLIAMALLLATSTRGLLNINAISLLLLTLLWLGVFTAGLSPWSWKLCVAGGLAVPLIAWVQRAALLMFLIGLAVIAIWLAVEFFRRRSRTRARNRSTGRVWSGVLGEAESSDLRL